MVRHALKMLQLFLCVSPFWNVNFALKNVLICLNLVELSLQILLSPRYGMRIMSFFFVQTISAYSLIIAAASSNFSILFPMSSKSGDSIFYTINQWAKQLLFNFLFVALIDSSFSNYGQKTAFRLLSLPKHCCFFVRTFSTKF